MKACLIAHYYQKKTRSFEFFADIAREVFESLDIFYDYYENENEFPVARAESLRAYEVKNGNYDRIIVWQSEAALEQLLRVEVPAENLLFVPMYDSFIHWGEAIFKMATQVKMICFSRAMSHALHGKGIDNLCVQYFPEPQPSARRKTTGPLKVLYWHRRDEGVENLRQLLSSISPAEVVELSVMNQPDPGHARLDLDPFSSRAIQVREVAWTSSRSDYLQNLADFDLYVAPRRYEGIGMSFLDAMARNVVCYGPEASTFNEYNFRFYNSLIAPPKQPVITKQHLTLLKENLATYMEEGYRQWRDHGRELVKACLKGQADEGYHSRTCATRRTFSIADLKESFDLTIVVPTFNCMSAVAATMNTIMAQSALDRCEIIVVDGASKDGTLQELAKYRSRLNAVISEPDTGPYDAMNKGVRIAKGTFVMFMNAGDRFASPDVVERFLPHLNAANDIVFGDHIYVSEDGREWLKQANSFDSTWRKLCQGDLDHSWLDGVPCHQSTIARTELLKNRPFRPEFTIAADHEALYHFRSTGSTFKKTNIISSLYFGGGLSARNSLRCALEWRRVALIYSRHKEKASDFFRKIILTELSHERFRGEAGYKMLIASNAVFEDWYLKTYPDVAAENFDPVLHYHLHGWRELRDPSPFFSTSEYLQHFPAVREANINPLLYYVTIGELEGNFASDLHFETMARLRKAYPDMSFSRFSLALKSAIATHHD